MMPEPNPYQTPDTPEARRPKSRHNNIGPLSNLSKSFICLIFSPLLIIGYIITDLTLTTAGREPHPLGRNVAIAIDAGVGTIAFVILLLGCFFAMKAINKNQVLGLVLLVLNFALSCVIGFCMASFYLS
jgi:hypothetical protein